MHRARARCCRYRLLHYSPERHKSKWPRKQKGGGGGVERRPTHELFGVRLQEGERGAAVGFDTTRRLAPVLPDAGPGSRDGEGGGDLLTKKCREVLSHARLSYRSLLNTPYLQWRTVVIIIFTR